MKELVISKVINKLGVIYFNRPEKLNALNFEMIIKLERS